MATLPGLKSLLRSSGFWDERPSIPQFDPQRVEVPAALEITPLAEQIAELVAPKKPRHETRGANPKWPWERATLETFGRIYRGEIHPMPEHLVEVENLLRDWFADRYNGEHPAESQIRDHARMILREMQA